MVSGIKQQQKQHHHRRQHHQQQRNKSSNNNKYISAITEPILTKLEIIAIATETISIHNINNSNNLLGL